MLSSSRPAGYFAASKNRVNLVCADILMSVESRYSVSCIECPKMLCKVASVRLSKNMRYFVFLAIFLSVLLPLQIFYVFLATNYDEFDIGVIYNSSREKNFTFDYITTCDLPEKDPWDPSIERFIDPSFTASNTVERRVVTALVDGVIIIRSDYKLEDCIGSCIWKTAEWNTTMDPWEPIATFQPMCDIVVVRCGNDPRNHPSYEALHSQIVEIKDKPNYGVHEPSDRLPEPPRGGRQTECLRLCGRLDLCVPSDQGAPENLQLTAKIV